MKNRNIIVLLSALLCLVVLFAACDKKEQETESATEKVTDTETVAETVSETVSETEEKTEAPTEPETHEPLLESVAPEFGNFFENLEKETSDPLSTVERVDKKIVSMDGERRFVVMMTKDVDTKNNVAVTYEVYNINKAEIVLTVEYEYYNGDYAAFDWNNLLVKENVVMVDEGSGYIVEKDLTVKYPEKVVEVAVVTSGNGLPYIIVKEAEITPVSDSDKEKNPDGCVYDIDIAYTYYDVAGNEITKANQPLRVSEESRDDEVVYNFGATRAYFDLETYELVALQNADSDEFRPAYDTKTEKYGYIFGSESNIAGLGYVEWFDVYDLATGERIYRKYLDDNWNDRQTFMLHNGNVLIQYENEVSEKENYDYTYHGSYFYKYEHYIFDVLDGTTKKIDIPYYISSINTPADYEDGYRGVKLTENVRNLAIAYDVSGGRWLDGDLVIFDNDMSVLYSIDSIVPEHKHGLNAYTYDEYDIGISILDNGDYLVTLDGAVTSRAIVKPDGTVRTYLKDGFRVVGNYIVNEIEKAIYDYDLNELFDFGTEDTEYEYFGRLFGRIVFAEEVKDEYDNVIGYNYLALYEGSEGGLYVTTLFDGENVLLVDGGEKYVVVQRESDDKFVLYNEDFETVLVTYSRMYIGEFNDGYAVFTNIAGDYVMYALK